MASITNPKLSIERDRKRKTAKIKVTAKIKFTSLELCLMKSCEKAKLFKLKCEIWGDDERFLEVGKNDKLYTIPRVIYFPDSSPSGTETITFTDTVGEGVLDEDKWWRPKDEIFGKLKLTNLLTGLTSSRDTNVVIDKY